MNIAVDAFAAGRAEVEKRLEEADLAVGGAIRAIARLQNFGIAAADTLGIRAGLIGQVLDYAGKANACVSRAAFELSGVHASLHEASERLLPSDPSPQSAGGKEPPPKP